MSKKDFIQDCMDSMPQQGSLDEFKKAFCDVCINPDCQRSRFTDSKWMTRMIMQEEALRNPIFGNPDDPRFAHLTDVHFEPVDEQTLKYYGGWVDVKEDGSVVNHGETPVESGDASKVETALRSLRQGSSPPKPVEEPQSDPEPEEAPAPSPEPEEPQEAHSVTEEPDPGPRKKKPAAPTRRARNTEVPSGGILLGPEPDKPKRASVLLKGQDDPWAVGRGAQKRGKNGKLTVRVSDGKVVKKED